MNSGSGQPRAKKPGEFIISSKAKKQGIKNIDDLKVEVAHRETTVHQQQRYEEEVQRHLPRKRPAQNQAEPDEERNRQNGQAHQTR